jgi:hypothetical protein
MGTMGTAPADAYGSPRAHAETAPPLGSGLPGRPGPPCRPRTARWSQRSGVSVDGTDPDTHRSPPQVKSADPAHGDRQPTPPSAGRDSPDSEDRTGRGGGAAAFHRHRLRGPSTPVPPMVSEGRPRRRRLGVPAARVHLERPDRARCPTGGRHAWPSRPTCATRPPVAVRLSGPRSPLHLPARSAAVTARSGTVAVTESPRRPGRR